MMVEPTRSHATAAQEYVYQPMPVMRTEGKQGIFVCIIIIIIIIIINLL